MTGLKLVGIAATAILMATSVQAESVDRRSGGTVYPVASKSLAAPLPVLPVSETIGRHEGRRRSAHRHAHVEVAAAAATSVEAPAPTPTNAAQSDAAETSQAPRDAQHEGPAPTIKDLVSKHAREAGVPENLASAVVRIESGFNPRARGGGALGLMQIKYQTARSVGFAGPAAGLMQAETNLHFGMKVLADAYKASGGNVCMTLARYQSGHLTTRMSSANRSYCARARAFMAKA